MTTTHMLNNDEADIAYDLHGALPTADRRPPLLMIGQPVTASGFGTLASHFADRTVVTYDPRGLGRSTRRDGRVENSLTVQANDVHALIHALGVGPVETFASSGGAVTALALVAAYPEDVVTLVAHEPLGQQAIVFPSHHGGFLGAESGYAGQPEAFARTLRAVLEDTH